jgi:hypothetical protein
MNKPRHQITVAAGTDEGAVRSEIGSKLGTVGLAVVMAPSIQYIITAAALRDKILLCLVTSASASAGSM